MKSPDPNQILQDDQAKLAAMIAEDEAMPRTVDGGESEAQKAEYQALTAAGRLDGLWAQTEKNKTLKPIETGFEKLDELLGGGLYPGVYVIGAIPALGKTAFALQIADTIASNGRDVLIASLEMDAGQIIYRSISRLTWEIAGERAYYKDSRYLKPDERTQSVDERRQALASYSRDIEWGRTKGTADEIQQRQEVLIEAKKRYSSFAGRVTFREGTEQGGKMRTLEGIKEAIKKHVDMTGQAPVVFIDFLQLIKPASDRMSDKQAIDDAIRGCVDIRAEYKTPVILIASLNRAGYDEPVTYSSFKESGGIEYAADVLIGLQLSYLADYYRPSSNSKGKLTKWRRGLRAATVDDKRKLDAVILKNRNGPLGGVELENAKAFFYFKDTAIINDEKRAKKIEKEEAEERAEIDQARATRAKSDSGKGSSNTLAAQGAR